MAKTQVRPGEDYTSRIERLEAFEDRLGIRLEALSAIVDYVFDDTYSISVNGELHPAYGTSLDRDVDLQVVAYDLQGRVLVTSTTGDFEAESFFGFEVFSESFSVPVGVGVSKIRILPRPR